MTSLWDMADKLGDMACMSEPDAIERPAVIETHVARLTRKDIWPPDVWAEMQRIQDESLGEVVDGLLGDAS